MISVAALEPAHAQSLATAANFPAVASALRNAFPSPYTIEDADWFISFAADNTANNIIKGIFVNNVCEGVCSLDQSRVDPFVWELGYWLRPALSGQGIATSAVKLLIEQVLSSSVAPQITRIEAKVLAGNVASQRVLAKNGFSHEGLMKNYSNHKDCHLYAFPLATFRRAATASSLRGNFIHCKARGEVQMLMDHVLSIDSDGVIVSLEEAGENGAINSVLPDALHAQIRLKTRCTRAARDVGPAQNDRLNATGSERAVCAERPAQTAPFASDACRTPGSDAVLRASCAFAGRIRPSL